MKKIYQNPEIKIVKIQTAQMVAASLNGMGSSGGTVDLTDTELDSGVEGESRRASFWDDDEE